MTDDTDQAAKDTAMARLRKADARVRKHEQERQELIDAIVSARLIGWRPSDIDDVVHYDRNHIGRLLKKAGATTPRAPKVQD
jgi:hypothetical protein